jgi:hypothetical protein
MAFAGIFHPFARLRWIRFGLFMRALKFSRRFSVPQTTALAPLAWLSMLAAAPLRACPWRSTGAAGLSRFASDAAGKENRQEVRGEEGETKEVTGSTADQRTRKAFVKIRFAT